MSDSDTDPLEHSEPKPDRPEETGYDKQIWLRGLWMLLFAMLFSLAGTILGVSAVIQFLWMLFAKKTNPLLADFGNDLGKWLHDVALFQTGATEQKPFPWKKWG